MPVRISRISYLQWKTRLKKEDSEFAPRRR
jgi:hypothetical protein